MGKNTSTSADAELLRQVRRPDLSVLGDAVKKLPVVQWQERMFFAGIDDCDLKSWTGGFPGTLRKEYGTHPLFVLRCHSSGHLVCPCTSKGRSRQRYIKKGCRLEMAEDFMDRKSYLVEYFSFTMPLDSRFIRKPIFVGRVPRCCIVDGSQNG